MRITLIANTGWTILNFREELIECLQARGGKISVLALPDESFGRLRQMGCECQPLEIDSRSKNVFREIGLLLQTYKALRQHPRPDIVLSFTVKPNIWGCIACRALSIPFLPNITGLGTVFLGRQFFQWIVVTLYRMSLAQLPIILFQNADDSAYFIKRRLARPEMVRHLPGSGVNLAKHIAQPMPPDARETRFLMVARLIEDKGVFEYVGAARALRATYPHLKFQLLGPLDKSPNPKITQDMLTQWQREGLIDYLGETESVAPYLTQAHAIVLPSYREGLPRTLLEGAATARPLIATDVPGCRDVVKDGVNGFLCAARDVSSLADACKRFAELSRKDQANMAAKSRTLAEKTFDVNLVIDAYLSAMAELGVPLPNVRS